MTYPAEVSVKDGKLHVELKNLSQLSLLGQKYNKEVLKDVKSNEDCEVYFFVHEDTVYQSKKYSEKVKADVEKIENLTPGKDETNVPYKGKPKTKPLVKKN